MPALQGCCRAAIAACLLTHLPVQAQNAAALGQAIFENRCSTCHGADGNGGELGPSLAGRIEALTDEAIQSTVQGGRPNRGMPANDVQEPELSQLIAFLRTLHPRVAGFEPYALRAPLSDGRTLSGTVLAEGVDDLQLRGDEGRLHLLRRQPGGRFREVTSQSDWTTYNGDPGGNRFTTLKQLTPANVHRLSPRWVFQMPGAAVLEGTPVVAAGVMYVTRANECFALDAGSGREIWHFQRARTRGLIGNAAGGINRGVAVAGEQLFMVTDDAHLIALDRGSGKLLWDHAIADWHQNYNATSAPLVVGGLVLTGTAGGEEGVRGFIAAFDQRSGQEVWRFWTVPAPGEAGSQTWQGRGIEHGGAVAWFTGVYDAETDTVFWPTGNPGDDYNGDERRGDNLYSDCILALDARTGRLKWYYQTTPHDVWDWDASETPLVIDAAWHGQQRRLLVQGNRNGFFYVLDRTNGQLLLAKSFINEMTWASGVGADGRPILKPDQQPDADGRRVCPSQPGATNWYSPAYDAATGLFYLQTNEKCSIYRKRADQFSYGRPFLGGAVKNDAQPPPRRILRALDLQSGAVRWQLPQVGLDNTAGGVLATASGLLFYDDDSGALAAADARSGRLLWSFAANATWRASPMAYQFDGDEFIGVAAGGSIMAFALVH